MEYSMTDVMCFGHSLAYHHLLAVLSCLLLFSMHFISDGNNVLCFAALK